MAPLQIRDVPDPLHQLLQLRPRWHLRSLSQQALSVLQHACGRDAVRPLAELQALGEQQQCRTFGPTPGKLDRIDLGEMAGLVAPKLVLDALAVVRIIEKAAQPDASQEDVLSADIVLAPELMLTEVANTLWRLQRAGQLEPNGWQQRINRAAKLVD